MTIDTFLTRFSEFRQVPDDRIQAALDAALAQLSPKTWSTQIDEGQLHLAAHLLSVSYVDPQDPNTGNYLGEFNRLKRSVAAGFRVA